MPSLPSKDYFALLHLPRSFALDAAALQRAYFTAQQEHHPDRQQGRDGLARQAAMQASMDANQAFATLKNPLLRAMHLLELEGIRVNGEGDTQKPEPALLMEVMEWREELEAAQGGPALNALAQRAAGQRAAALEALATAFATQDLVKAAKQCIRLRYLEKFAEEALLRLRAAQTEG